ncbi:Uncharacterized protein APZ42_006514 [Daphnia magna]|uniref:Uncharacterized protein n=1 Tax=Daphnia magna TaxID=35525 RepID=A0A164FUW3_9CRUS|nr:Uncharacterized protein APZ42_006514 [Daphnia magna]
MCSLKQHRVDFTNQEEKKGQDKMRTRTVDCGHEKLRTFTCGLAQNF